VDHTVPGWDDSGEIRGAEKCLGTMRHPFEQCIPASLIEFPKDIIQQEEWRNPVLTGQKGGNREF
jgi:hypothetical protein